MEVQNLQPSTPSLLTPTSTLIAVLAGLVTYLVITARRRPKGIPPGPPAIPILGSLPFINFKDLNRECIRLAEVYGDVFSIYFGPRLVIVLNNFENIREAFVVKGIDFAGRYTKNDPRMTAVNPYFPIHGLLQSSHSPEWKRQRNTAVSFLRVLGLGRSGVEEHIKDECGLLVDNFKKQDGLAFCPTKMIGVSIANVICGLLFGNRYNHDDKDFVELLELVDKYFISRYANADSATIPLLRYRKSYREGIENLRKFNNEFYDFSQRKIEEGRKRLSEGEEPMDFVTLYLKEMDKAEEGGEARISEDWLGPIIRDFFNAGSETSSTTLTWMVMYMAAHQDVQKKVQAELDEAFGGLGEHEFSLTDSQNLPYLEATIIETQRLASIAPFAIPHTAMKDTQFKGYTIPKDTTILANLYSSSVDTRLWEDPHTFNPERFLDAEGQVNKPEFWIPYSMGRRMCLGEQLAKQELFLFTAYMINAFHIDFHPEHRPASLEADYSSQVRKPKPFKLVVTPRF